MKKSMTILLAACLLLPLNLFSQDKRAIKAAELSYSSAEDNFKKGNFQNAAQKYEIVVSTFPEGIESRKHLIMRLESLIMLVDIYFYKYINFTEACKYTDLYFSTMNTIRNSGVLKGRELYNYLEKEKEFDQHKTKCEGYENVSGDMDKFRKTFDKEFQE
jgi:outer membrane protein assembly factor BamD (BamD/ComL family)